MILEVYVEPLAPGGARFGHRNSDELRADSLPGCTHAYHCVHDEGVYPAVPRDVYESDQPVFVVGAYPAEAVFQYLDFPVVVEYLVVK